MRKEYSLNDLKDLWNSLCEKGSVLVAMADAANTPSLVGSGNGTGAVPLTPGVVSQGSQGSPTEPQGSTVSAGLSSGVDPLQQRDPWGSFAPGVNVSGTSLFGNNDGSIGLQQGPPGIPQYFNIGDGSGNSSFASGHSVMPPSTGVSSFGAGPNFWNQDGSAVIPPQPSLGCFASSAPYAGGQAPDPSQTASQTSCPGMNPGPVPTQSTTDPVVVQLLQQQMVLTQALVQMLQNQQAVHAAVPSASVAAPAAAPTVVTGAPGRSTGMDTKWLPSCPMPNWKQWSSRVKELSGFRSWLEQFTGWMSLIHDQYGPELQEAVKLETPVNVVDPDQSMRSRRLFHLIQQCFAGYNKVENMVRSQITARGSAESNGFEMLRLIRREFSLLSRTEALHYREQTLKYSIRKPQIDTLPEILREIHTEIENYHSMLEGSINYRALIDLRITEGDQFLLYLRNLPERVVDHVQMIVGATTVMHLWQAVQQYYVRSRSTSLVTERAHVTQAHAAGKKCHNCGKEGHFQADCPEPPKCKFCGKPGHIEKDCWKKNPDKKPSKGSKTEAKAKPKSTPKQKGKGKGKGRGRGGRYRGVDGEEQGDGEEQEGEQEPEEETGETQITMMIGEAGASSGTRSTEGSMQQYLSAEAHRSDSHQKVCTIGSSEDCWLVDSGATCHILSEQFVHLYEVLHTYPGPPPILRGASNHIIPTKGLVDLKIKLGKIQVVMRKVVIAAIDLNVLSTYALMEAGWRTILGGPKDSRLEFGKHTFALYLADRSWWLKVGSNKKNNVQTKKTQKKTDKPVPMDLSAVTDQTVPVTEEPVSKVDDSNLTQVPSSHVVAQTSSSAASTSPSKNVKSSKPNRKKGSQTREEVVGSFSYVCRMFSYVDPATLTEQKFNEPNLENREGPGDCNLDCQGDVCESQEPRETHRCFGFPQQVDVSDNGEEGDQGGSEHAMSDGYVPTSPAQSDAPRLPSDSHEPVAPIPGKHHYDPTYSDDDAACTPELEGNSLERHESRGHWPYDKGCQACVQARGRVPARRRKEGVSSECDLGADLCYVAGRHWKILVMLIIQTGMMGCVVLGSSRDSNHRAIVSVLNEMGVGGKSVELSIDNEPYLLTLMQRGLEASACRSYHQRNIAENRPTSKGIERAVGILKEGLFTVWLALERHVNCRLALESPLFGHLVGYTFRTFNIFSKRPKGCTPLEGLRERREGQTPASYPFGIVGYAKPVEPSRWPGQRLILCAYLGMRYSTGGGCLVYPSTEDRLGVREVVRAHNFRIIDNFEGMEPALKYDIQLLFPLMAGVRPEGQVPELPPIPFGDRMDKPGIEAPPAVPHVEPSTPQSFPEMPAEPSIDVPMEPADDAQGPQPMTLDQVSEDQEGDGGLNEIIYQSQCELWNEFCRKQEHLEVEDEEGTTFSTHFGGMDIDVHVPIKNYDELTGMELDHQQTVKGFRTEVEGLEKLQVGVCLKETDARKMAREKKVKLLSSRWVKTQKTADIVRCRLVVRDFASGAESAFRSGIYAPTSSLDSLRCLLAWIVMHSYHILTADVSVAFMNAPVEEWAVDLVLLPLTFSVGKNRCRLALLLKKAMNGLRRAPLLWFLELQRVIVSLNGQETFEVTLFRIKGEKGLVLVLVYVDDLMIASEYVEDGEKFLEHLQSIWSIKLTGKIAAREKGAVNFLGRIIYRPANGGNELYMGVTKTYMEGIFTSWDETLKPQAEGSTMPRLEELYKDAEKKFEGQVLSEAAVVRYRRVLGQMAWAALSRADLSFAVSYLSRFQSSPTPIAESLMRSVLRWLLTRLHFVQRFPAEEPPLITSENVILSFCDASWSTSSVSGAILVWCGSAVKFFSRRQEVPALSSAEAEVIAMVETAKEMVAIGMLIQTIEKGIPLDNLGFPQQTTGEYRLEMKNDARAALSISSMQGLLRRVRHLELRVAYIQHLHHRGRLSLEHWTGITNPADGLTKSIKTLDMLLNLTQAIGLTKGLSEEGFKWVSSYLRSFDADFAAESREGE